ncbi:sodium- and chloride-dependent GABA transporter 1-like [Haliotis rubra]|uniref:sodium- and chloride-dependent GABA transporter 1-like n=1 Tax=Haliotis rubra TaxID=36100 RepID=UPI001EE533E1|nr:sodium- and chloride-dependent GABA transporter 1-like [Haliotis rubra]
MIRGVKSVGKAVYVTAILPYILLIIIFISTLIQPGAGSGLLYYVTPDFRKLQDVKVCSAESTAQTVLAGFGGRAL